MPKNNPAGYFQGGQGGQGKMAGGAPGQPNPQALMQQQQMPSIMAGVGQPAGGMAAMQQPQGLPPGIDPQAVAADPQGYQRWLQGRAQQMQQMQGMGMAPQGMQGQLDPNAVPGQMVPGSGGGGMLPPGFGQENNPVTQMPQIRGRVAPGQGMPPQQFQAPQGRVDPRQFAAMLAQQRAMQPARRPGGGVAEYQANQAAKLQAIKDAAAKKVADAKSAKLRAKQDLLNSTAAPGMQVQPELHGGGY